MSTTFHEQVSRLVFEQTYRYEQLLYWRALGFNVTPTLALETLFVYIEKAYEDNLMARGKSKRAGSGGYDIKFLSANMTVEEKASFREYDANNDKLAGYIIELMDSGYKWSGGFDKNNESCYVTITNKDGDSKFKGYALTCYAGTAKKALLLAVFKHFVLADGDWAYWDEGESDDFG